MTLKLTTAQIERFHSRIERQPDGCWTWSGEVNNRGYGRFVVYRGDTRVRLLAHRLAYALEVGVDPISLVVRHRCDNPPCCNPAHLEVGTQLDNIRDTIARGRMNIDGLAAYREARAAAGRRRLERGRKPCCRCRVDKPLDDFRRENANTDGRSGTCRLCLAGRY